MPVAFDSSNSAAEIVGGLESSESITLEHVTTTLGSDLCGVVAVQVTSGVDISASTVTATWGGAAMTLVPSSRVTYDADECYVALFYIMNPLTGPQDVVVSVASLATELAGRGLMVCSVSYTGVASVGEAETVAASGFATSPALTVDGVAPAHCIVAALGVDGLFFGDIKATTATKRAQSIAISTGELWLVDAEGDDNKVIGFTINNSDHWAGSAVVLAPAVVTGEAEMDVVATTEARAGLKREAPPHRSRYFLIPPA